MAGATYKLMPGLTLYGGYSEANRAPTAAELACADPDNPCLIESFLTADPPLKQVVSHTFELGLRGKLASLAAASSLEWTAGLFRTRTPTTSCDRLARSNGRGYFQNAGDTLRQGFEAGRSLSGCAAGKRTRTTRSSTRPSRRPTFSRRPTITGRRIRIDIRDLRSGPDEPQCASSVNPGDRLPGVPRHRFKAGVDYWVTTALEGWRRRRRRQRPSILRR